LGEREKENWGDRRAGGKKVMLVREKKEVGNKFSIVPE